MSPDEAAFLKVIRDNPADETARSVYADWLADRDDRDDTGATFVRFSSEFLRCVRCLADARRALPKAWLDAVDPLFGRFFVHRLPELGEGVLEAGVTEVQVSPGVSVTQGQGLITVETDKASIEPTAERAGLITSVLVQVGDRVRIGQPILTYLSLPNSTPSVPAPMPISAPPPHRPLAEPLVPPEPLRAFIRSLEGRREVLRSAPSELIEALIARHTTAAVMVFGGDAVRQGRRVAEMNLGWNTVSCRLETRMQQHGAKADQFPQIRLDIHLEMLRVLLRRHGQPVGFRELPDDAPAADE